MDFGGQGSLRGGGPCEKGHAFVPIAPSRNRPRFTDFHCSRCGEWTSMKADGEPNPDIVIDARFAALEARITELENRLNRPALPAPAKE